MEKIPCVYIMTNRKLGTIYIGVTSNLLKRVWEHRRSKVEGFSRRYGLKRLVYFEILEDMICAIEREKQLKNWKRQWKLELIDKFNPQWHDLYSSILDH
jgi:putative endonuclease